MKKIIYLLILSINLTCQESICNMDILALAKLNPAKVLKTTQNKKLMKSLQAKHGIKLNYAVEKWLAKGLAASTFQGPFTKVTAEQPVEEGKVSVDRLFTYLAIGKKIYANSVSGSIRTLTSHSYPCNYYHDQPDDQPVDCFAENDLVQVNSSTVSPTGDMIVSCTTSKSHDDDSKALAFEHSAIEDTVDLADWWGFEMHPTTTALISSNSRSFIFNPGDEDHGFIVSEYWGNEERYFRKKILGFGDRNVWYIDNNYIKLAKIINDGQNHLWPHDRFVIEEEHDPEEGTNLIFMQGFSYKNPQDDITIEAFAQDTLAQRIAIVLKSVHADQVSKKVFMVFEGRNYAMVLDQIFAKEKLNNIYKIAMSGAGNTSIIAVGRQEAHADEIDIVNLNLKKVRTLKLGTGERLNDIFLNNNGRILLIHARKADGQNFIINSEI